MEKAEIDYKSVHQKIMMIFRGNGYSHNTIHSGASVFQTAGTEYECGDAETVCFTQLLREQLLFNCYYYIECEVNIVFNTIDALQAYNPKE